MVSNFLNVVKSILQDNETKALVRQSFIDFLDYIVYNIGIEDKLPSLDLIET